MATSRDEEALLCTQILPPELPPTAAEPGYDAPGSVALTMSTNLPIHEGSPHPSARSNKLLRFNDESELQGQQTKTKRRLGAFGKEKQMKKLANVLATALLIGACSVAFAGKGNSAKQVGNLGNPGVAPPQSMAYGKSYSEWSMAWWVYAITKPLDVNPFGNGTDGTIGQSGPVWFLGGTFVGSPSTIERTITMPPGTALFFPVMDVECSTIETPESGFHGDDEASLRACAKGWADQQGAGAFGPLFCRVDGVELINVTAYRFATPLMHFILPAMDANNNIFYMPVAEGQEVYSVGDGYYILLNPLSVGTHTVEFPGIHYTIHVGPHE